MVDVKQIKEFLIEFAQIAGTTSINPATRVVDVNGSVRLYGEYSELPVQFGTVTQYFWCGQKGLTTLKGVPHTVGEYFNCDFNQLTSLEHGPTNVGGHYFCNHNQLKNLVGSPQVIKKNFYCDNNMLQSLEGSPREVHGDFHVWDNQFLENLTGSPSHVKGEFIVTYSPQLALLQLLKYNNFNIVSCPPEVEHIMQQHAGEGKKGSVPCAVALTKAGFKENARW